MHGTLRRIGLLDIVNAVISERCPQNARAAEVDAASNEHLRTEWRERTVSYLRPWLGQCERSGASDIGGCIKFDVPVNDLEFGAGRRLAILISVHGHGAELRGMR